MRIKFYSISDLSCYWMLHEVEKYLESGYHKPDNVNDIIELYNIKKFFDNNIYLKSWDYITRDKYISIVKDYAKQIPLFFKNMSNKDLCKYYSQIENGYKKDFWEILDLYGFIKNNPNLIKEEDFTLDYAYDFLYRKNLLKMYQNIVKEQLLNDPFLVETIIRYDTSKQKTFNLPEFEEDELERITINYIKNENANPNYLNYIYSIGRLNSYQVDPMIRIEAKSKYSSLFAKMPKDNQKGFEFGISIIFKDNDEIRTVIQKDKLYEIIFDAKWFKNHLDYPTILNNFIYVFEFVDSEFRLYFSKNNNSEEFLFSQLGVHSLHEYKFGIDKSFLELYSTTTLRAYIEFLNKNSINIEVIFQWFFSVYLKEEFGIEGFIFHKTTEEASYLEKCRMLFAELDGILKQFDFYCKYKLIDREALDFYQSVRASDIKSLINNKYIYCQDSKLINLNNLLFSRNSIINITFDDNHYSSFVDLIMREHVKLDVFPEYQKCIINDLIENNMIFIENEFLTIPREKYYLFKDLFENQVISRYHTRCTPYIIDDYVDKGLLKYESTLLTKEESNFYDYMLNNQRFDNNRAIRNSYMHGTNILNEDKHLETYYLIIKLILLLIIKINDEFVTVL